MGREIVTVKDRRTDAGFSHSPPSIRVAYCFERGLKELRLVGRVSRPLQCGLSTLSSLCSETLGRDISGLLWFSWGDKLGKEALVPGGI